MSSVSPLDQEIIHLKRKIWKLKTIPKIRLLQRRAVSGALAVADIIKLRGLVVHVECKLCNKKLESINHVLFESIPAQDILQTVNFPSATSPARNLGEKMKLALKIMSDTTVPENIRRAVPTKSTEPRVVQLSSLEVYHHWHPPTFGMVKCN